MRRRERERRGVSGGGPRGEGTPRTGDREAERRQAVAEAHRARRRGLHINTLLERGGWSCGDSLNARFHLHPRQLLISDSKAHALAGISKSIGYSLFSSYDSSSSSHLSFSRGIQSQSLGYLCLMDGRGKGKVSRWMRCTCICMACLSTACKSVIAIIIPI
jgi:hypothetical protein